MTDKAPNGTKIGANDPCFCGSNKKYKRCCRNKRQFGGTVTNPQVAQIEKLLRAKTNDDTCYHPDAPKDCSGKTINAHTVSKSQNLLPIAENGHVVGFNFPTLFDLRDTQGKPPRYKLVGINKASTFRGFCANHDKQLFSEIEDKPLIPTQLQISVLCYRTICREIRGKESLAGNQDILNEVMPERHPATKLAQHNQIMRSMHTLALTSAALRGLEDLHKSKDELEAHIFHNDTPPLSSVVVEYTQPLPLSVSGAFSFQLNPFSGKHVQDLLDYNADAAHLFAHCVHAHNKSMIILSHFSQRDNPAKSILDSIGQLDFNIASSLLLEYIVSNLENVFFKPSWYDSLNSTSKELLDEWAARNTDPAQEHPELPLRLTAAGWPIPAPSDIRLI